MTTTLAQIAAPDADHAEDWVDWNDTGEFVPYMRGTRRTVAGVEIRIAGWQDGRGAVARHACVWATDTQLDAATLRKLAALALDAAAELDQLAQRFAPSSVSKWHRHESRSGTAMKLVFASQGAPTQSKIFMPTTV